MQEKGDSPIRFDPRSPRLLQGKLSGEIRSESDLLDFFNPAGQGKSLVASTSDLRIVKQDRDSAGKRHVLLQQYYRGLPVYGQYVQAHIGTDQRIYAIANDASAALDGIAIDTTPALDDAQAAAALRTAVEASIGGAITLGGSIGARQLGEPTAELMIYPQDDGAYRLAYRVELEYLSPSMNRWVGFVDALTGEVVKKFSALEQAAPEDSVLGSGYGSDDQERDLNMTRSGDTYYLIDKSKPMYRRIYSEESGVIATYDNANPFLPVYSDGYPFIRNNPEAVDAHYFAGQVYDFYLQQFQRDSLDGNGMSINSIVNVGAIDNAFWDGYEMVYGDGNLSFDCLVCASDVVAHEMTHGVTQHTADLEYVGQSGALNESFSDIMAVVFDADDWTIGEDAGITAGYGLLRSLKYPALGLDPQPATMSEYVVLPEDENHDNGGVHINSGIPNHAAYLTAEKIDAIPALNGQGRTLLGRLAYAALTAYLTPTSGFAEARDAFVLAAGDLDLDDGLKALVTQAVIEAWAEVGLSYADSENDIVSFSVPGMLGKPAIDRQAHTVAFEAAYGTDLHALTPSIQVSPGAVLAPEPTEPQDFSVPVTYTVTAQDGTAQEWTIQGTVVDPASANDILVVDSEVQTGPAIIDKANHRVTIYAESTDDVTSLHPYLEVSPGATVSPASLAAVNLSQPVVYTVTAQNGDQQQWTVTAVKDSASPKFLGAVAMNSNIVGLVFNQEMDLSTLGSPSQYRLESLDPSLQDPQVTTVQIDCDDPGVVYLTTTGLASSNGYALEVSGLKGANGRAVRADTVTAYFLADDRLPPVLQTARVDGSLLSLAFNETVTNIYSAPGFQVKINGVPVEYEQVGLVGRRINFRLNAYVKETDNVTVSYTKSNVSLPITDLSGNPLGDMKDIPVLNRTRQLKTAAGEDWLRLDSDVKHMIKHPTAPIVYAIFNNSNTVVSANLETGEIREAELDRQAERLYAANGKIYVALVDRPNGYTWWAEEQTGGLAVLDDSTLEIVHQYVINLDPFDLAADGAGHIYVASGSGQFTWLQSYSEASGTLLDQANIWDHTYLTASFDKNRLYSITTNLSPRDITAYNVDENGMFTDPKYPGGYDSPYHGDYDMTPFMRLSPDGQYLLNGAGTIFRSTAATETDMTYVKSINPFDDIAFAADGSKFYTLKKSELLKGAILRVYDSSSLEEDYRLTLPTNTEGILTGNAPGELLVVLREGNAVTVAAMSVDPLANSADDIAPSLTGNRGLIAFQACPIPSSNGNGGNTTPPPPPPPPPIIIPPIVIPSTGGGADPETPDAEVPAAEGAPLGDAPGSATLGKDDAQTEQRTNADGSIAVTVKPDAGKLSQALETAKERAKESKEPVTPRVVIPVAGNPKSVDVELPVSALLDAATTAKDAVLSVQSDGASYDVPVSLFAGDALKQAFGGASVGSGQVKIAMTKPDAATKSQITQSLAAGYRTLVEPVNFSLTVEANGTSKEITDFRGTYVTRTLVMTGNVAASEVSAVVYDERARQTSFVPAFVRTAGGKTYVDIKAPHNSIYTVVQGKKTFRDTAGHWARADIELLASKRMIAGVTEAEYQPEKTVTRAEFAALLVRALGLVEPQGGSRFSDVKPKDWFAGSVAAAAQAGLISGYENGTFAPNGIITRQEMAVMIGKAVLYAGGSWQETDAKKVDLSKYPDAGKLGGWASADMKRMLASGILEGISGRLEPTQPVNRAYAAVALKRMLQLLQFIN